MGNVLVWDPIFNFDQTHVPIGTIAACQISLNEPEEPHKLTGVSGQSRRPLREYDPQVPAVPFEETDQHSRPFGPETLRILRDRRLWLGDPHLRHDLPGCLLDPLLLGLVRRGWRPVKAELLGQREEPLRGVVRSRVHEGRRAQWWKRRRWWENKSSEKWDHQQWYSFVEIGPVPACLKREFFKPPIGNRNSWYFSACYCTTNWTLTCNNHILIQSFSTEMQTILLSWNSTNVLTWRSVMGTWSDFLPQVEETVYF